MMDGLEFDSFFSSFEHPVHMKKTKRLVKTVTLIKINDLIHTNIHINDED